MNDAIPVGTANTVHTNLLLKVRRLKRVVGLSFEYRGSSEVLGITLKGAYPTAAPCAILLCGHSNRDHIGQCGLVWEDILGV